MYSENISFLNRPLAEAVDSFDEQVKAGRPLFKHADKALQVCTNEHEAAYVVRHVRKALCESSGQTRNIDIWKFIDALLSRFWFREADPGLLLPFTPSPAMESAVVAIAAHTLQSRSNPGRPEIKDLVKDEFSTEFHKPLDRNLKNLVPVFVDVERKRIAISDTEVLNSVRTLVDELFSSIAKGEKEGRVEKRLAEMQIDPIDASAISMVGQLAEIIRILNLAAFDALYVSVDAAKETLKPLKATLASLRQGDVEDAESSENHDETFNVQIYVDLMNVLVACALSSSINVPLLSAPNLLLGSLRVKLAEQLFRRLQINGFTGGDFDSANQLCKFGTFEDANDVVRKIVRRLVDRCLDSELVSFAIRYACDLYEGPNESLKSRWKIWTYLSDALTNAADADWLDIVRGDDEVSRLREAILNEIRKSPESGVRLGVENFRFDDGGYNGIWGFVFHAQVSGFLNALPAFLRLVKLASDEEVEEADNISSTRDQNYLWAAEGCLEEGLDSTASRLLEFWLVTTRFEDYGTWLSHGIDVPGRVLNLRRLVAKLSSRVDCTQLARAIEIARQLHISFKGMRSEDQDFVTQELEESYRFLRSKFPGLSSEGLTGDRVSVHYKHRLSVLSAGNSERWPSVVVRRFEQIENERDFILGNRRIRDIDRESDFPWVVSYHKMLEIPLSRKLSFLFEDPYKSTVERLTNRKLERHFQPFVALKLLKTVPRVGEEYDFLRNELVSRQIDLRLARKFLDDLIEVAKIRNFQAHDMVSYAKAEQHREWVLENFQRLIEAFGLTESDFREFLH